MGRRNSSKHFQGLSGFRVKVALISELPGDYWCRFSGLCALYCISYMMWVIFLCREPEVSQGSGYKASRIAPRKSHAAILSAPAYKALNPVVPASLGSSLASAWTVCLPQCACKLQEPSRTKRNQLKPPARWAAAGKPG